MKKAILFILILTSLQSIGQKAGVFDEFNGITVSDTIYAYTSSIPQWQNPPMTNMSLAFSGGIIIKSKYDTTVLFSGIKHIPSDCKHDWAFEEKKTPFFIQTCAVVHGDAGCPAYWLNKNQICTICLLHVNIQETRSVEKIEEPKDRYKEAVEKLKKLQSK